MWVILATYVHPGMILQVARMKVCLPRIFLVLKKVFATSSWWRGSILGGAYRYPRYHIPAIFGNETYNYDLGYMFLLMLHGTGSFTYIYHKLLSKWQKSIPVPASGYCNMCIIQYLGKNGVKYPRKKKKAGKKWMFPKIREKTPQMDGENNGKPYFLMGWFGGKPTIFGNTQIGPSHFTQTAVPRFQVRLLRGNSSSNEVSISLGARSRNVLLLAFFWGRGGKDSSTQPIA